MGGGENTENRENRMPNNAARVDTGLNVNCSEVERGCFVADGRRSRPPGHFVTP